MATKLTSERMLQLIEAYGYTDKQMKAVLRSRGFKDLNEEIVLAECATNMGFIWSFQLNVWFDKNPTGIEPDEEDYDALLDEIREEKERK